MPKEDSKIKLIYRFFEGNATNAEKDELLAWIQQSEENKTYCMYCYQKWTKENALKYHFDADTGWHNIMRTLKLEPKRPLLMVRLSYVIASAAAVLILLAGIFYLVESDFHKVSITQFARSTMAKVNMMSSNVKLLLSSDSVLSIESQTPQIQYASNKVTIDKSIASGEISEDSYNQLIVPYGHRSQLTLTDGTKIWLNSGTRLVYPEKFSGKNREIYVEGEIYLEVRHDADHPFIVRSNNMDVQVLGTKFDVKTYLGEHLNRVVLLNGSVKVTQNDKFALLRPGYMYESQNGSPVVEQVDTYHYISWIYGFYEFESEKLSRIFAELEKYYNINIVCDKNAALLECSGKLNLNDNFQKVISSICETAPVDFQYNNGIYRVRLK